MDFRLCKALSVYTRRQLPLPVEAMVVSVVLQESMSSQSQRINSCSHEKCGLGKDEAEDGQR